MKQIMSNDRIIWGTKMNWRSSIVMLLILLFGLNVSGYSYNTKITLDLKDVSISSVIHESDIENQTNPQQAVKGVVTDETGMAMPGVNILIKGTDQGAVTDFDGNYQITVNTGDVIVFSYVGYVTQEITYSGQTSINVRLVEDASKLDEVVIIGYGTVTKEEITSAVVSVDAEEFNQGNVSSPAQLLQGKVAGLNIAKAGGDPNQPFSVRLRGLSTFGANSEPLVVIDGTIGGSIDSVDPSDIASINVLKDASAAAIYGTRGSSGVIIITTKSGGSGFSKPILEYNGYVAIESISNTINIANREEFLANGGADLGADTNWLDEVSSNGISLVNNLSFSNSTENGLNYRASINYRDVEGVLDGTGFDQFNARINVSQKLINDKLKLSSIISVTDRDANIGFAQALRYSLNFIPTAPVFENRTAGQLGRDPSLYGGYFETGVQDVYNPVAINTLNSRLEERKSFSGNFKAEYEVIEGLNLSALYSKEVRSTLGGEYFSSLSLFNGSAVNGSASRSLSESSTDLFELLVDYRVDANDFIIDFLGGYSFQQFDFQGFGATNTDFITNDVGFHNLGLGLGIDNNEANVYSYRSEAKLSAYFGRVNVNYKNMVFASASYRREASSRFGENNRWGNFWAVSGGVSVAQLIELPDFVDRLKLRGGYGVTGNEPAPLYAFLERLGKVGSGYVNGEFVPAIAPVSNPNPDLKWEEKGEFNIGLDFGLFDSKLSGSFDYFIRNTTDLLNTIPVPSPPNLFSTSLVNLGELETKGFEAQLNYMAVDNDNFSWDIGANFSTFESVLVNLNEQEDFVTHRGNLGDPGLNNTFVVRVAEGEEIGQIRAAVFAGYNDLGQTLVINQETGEATTERNIDRDGVVVGNGLPDFTFGINNSLKYKNFDLNFFLRGSVGHSLVNIQRAYFEHPSLTGRQNIVLTDNFNSNDTEQDAYHSGYVEKADFIRLDNATLGYNFDLKEKGALDNLRVYISANNLFTITNYSGADPEVRYSDPGPITIGDSRRAYGGDILVPGIDRRVTYLPTSAVTFGINVKF
jgi:iron complex outermembrane receptor protein